MPEQPRKFNVLVTGTPGTGKSSLCAMLQEELGLKHLEIGKIVKEHSFYSEFDANYDSYVVEDDDEDRLLDYLEPLLVEGGCVVDYHSSELFPKRWFHAVIVLRADTDKVFDRLTARGYSEKKREENLDAEIQGLCEEEARESYDEEVVITRPSNCVEDMLETVELVRSLQEEFTTHGYRRPGEASVLLAA
jgi:adenylate kinase